MIRLKNPLDPSGMTWVLLLMGFGGQGVRGVADLLVDLEEKVKILNEAESIIEAVITVPLKNGKADNGRSEVEMVRALL
ncbi:MAG: hypothetical protein QMC83_09785 [Thermodesulfovibrionales bacterium]|nr:hypothetical protein [Thermodesulfovibrionales bacterium]